jgi:Uma2 family endonuclease
MGDRAAPEALVVRWQQVLRDPSLHDLPYKIELNASGKVEMTPASNRHSRLQATLAAELGRQLQGMVLIGCSILTRSGVRSPDVAWGSPEFMRAFGEMTPYTRAPEICIEIVQPSMLAAEIAERAGAYLTAGAEEVWLVSEEGSVRYVGPSGDQPRSRFPVAFSLPAPLKGSP